MTGSHEHGCQLSRPAQDIGHTNGCVFPGLKNPGSAFSLSLAVLHILAAATVGAETNTALAQTNKPAEAPLRVAFSGSMFMDVNENDAAAAVRVWAQMLGNDHAIPVDPVVKILRGTNAIYQAMRNGAVDVMTLTTDEYWAVRKDVSFGSFVYGKRGEGITEKYILLAHRDSGITQISDLKARNLLILRNPGLSLAPAWLDSLVANANGSNVKAFFGNVTESTKLTRALLPVFFRQSDACLVTKQGFQVATELNPQVGQQLKIIAASPEFVPVVCCLRSNSTSIYMNKLRAEIGNVNTTPAGRQFMTLFQCEALIEGPESALQSAVDLLDQWNRLGSSLVPIKQERP